MTPERRVSASRLKSLDACTMSFYLSEYENLPQKVWAKTHAGSTVHSILEALRRDRHRAHLDLVKEKGTIYASPAISRLVRAWVAKTKMGPDIVEPIDAMCMLVLNQTSFLDTGATKTFDPEHEFKLTLPRGGTVKGFIDRLAIYGEGDSRRAVITDYKSQGKRFTANELRDNYQALTYQLYVWRAFGIPATVEFIMLRHPPTSRTPEKHIQRVEPSTSAQLAGFEAYLDHIHAELQTFGLKEAYSHFHDDEGFCRNVCTYFRPYDYHHVTKRDGTFVGNFMLDNLRHLGQDEVAQTRHYAGCPRWNTT